MQQQEHLPSLGPSAYCYNKTNISKLRNKISVSDTTILLERSNQLFQTIIEQQESHYICDGDKISKEKEFIEIYNNIAANGSTDILEIDLDIFDFVLFLCTHIRNSNEAMNIDLTKIVKYLAIDEHCVIQLIDILLMHEQPLTMNLLNEKLFLIPADAILMLTMIWAEIKCEKVARLFEQYLSNPSDSDITEKDRNRAEEEFNKLLEMHLELYRDPNQEEAKMQEEFEKDMESALKIIKDQMDIREICNEATKLDQILSHVPEHSYRIVTVLDSTDESDSDNSEDDDICVFTRITSKWPNWLVDNLCQSNLDKHISMELKQCCFAPIGKLFVENPNAGKAKGYAKCLLLEKNNDRFVVQGISPKDGSSTVKAIIDRNDLALGDAPSIRCEEGTRVIALAEQIAENVGPWNTKYFAGTIGVQPFSQNRFEYLIFFDNGFDAYVKPEDIRLLINQPTDECGNFMPRNAHSKIPTDYKERTEFLRQYLLTYPDWPLIQLKKMENTQRVLATKNGIKESAYVLDIDRHLALLRFPGKVSWQNSSKECVIINCKEHKHFDEWVYRGNQSRFPTLLEYVQKMTGKINTIAKSSKRKIHGQIEMAYPIYKENFSDTLRWLQDSENKQTARKSAKRPIIENVSRGLLQRKVNPDKEMQRKKQQSMKVTEEKVKVPKWKYPKQTHRFCSPNCVQKIDSDPHAFDRSHISAYFIPLLYGWTRLTVNLITQIKKSKSKYWASERIQYIAPCGIKLNDIDQVAEYLRTTGEGRYEINNFTFDPQVRPNIRIKMENISIDDFTEGQETMKISLVNVVNNERAPKITYRPKRTGVVKNMTDEEDENSRKRINAMEIKNEFCSGCSCTDNCATNENCECRRLTIEAQNRLSESLQVDKSAKKGYFHRMLEERHLSGIYECNLHCKCLKSLCPNRVVQQDLKIPMQLFMTAEKGWGVRTLVDIPKYTFVCTYSGELLDEKVADEQGRKFGDKFLCDLNLVQIVEEEKMQQGIDLIGDEGLGADEEDEEEAHLGIKINQRSSGTMPSNFSDDEAIHEPSSSRQMVGAFEDVDIEADGDQPSEMDEIIRDEANKRQEGRPTSEEKANRPWKYNEFNAYFPNNFLFVIDAAMTGNIGRFLNHSCDPNCIIQNCFVDTHDLRLPWVAFFTTKFIKAGEELTWNYAYEVDSVEGKQIECYCGAANCIGRLL